MLTSATYTWTKAARRNKPPKQFSTMWYEYSYSTMAWKYRLTRNRCDVTLTFSTWKIKLAALAFAKPKEAGSVQRKQLELARPFCVHGTSDTRGRSEKKNQFKKTSERNFRPLRAFGYPRQNQIKNTFGLGDGRGFGAGVRSKISISSSSTMTWRCAAWSWKRTRRRGANYVLRCWVG